MENQKVVVGGSVQGDITSCKIETTDIKHERTSLITFSENVTYASYDVCNKRIISQYTNPEWTVFGGLMFPLIVYIVISALFAFIKSLSS